MFEAIEMVALVSENAISNSKQDLKSDSSYQEWPSADPENWLSWVFFKFRIFFPFSPREKGTKSE